MKSETLPFTVMLYGEDLSKKEKTDGRHIARHHHFGSLHDAFLFLASVDVAHFDQLHAAEKPNPLFFSKAQIVHQAGEQALLSLLRLGFDDSPDGMPPPGIYFVIHEDLQVFGDVSGISLSKLGMYDLGDPHIFVAQFRFDERYEMLVQPEFERFQQDISTGQAFAAIGPSEWRYTVHIHSRHYADDLTDAVKHDVRKEHGALGVEEVYYYHGLRDAFARMLFIDHYAMDHTLATDRGLGFQIVHASVSDSHNMLAWLTFNRENQPGQAAENGVYVNFNIPLQEMEQQTGLDLSGLPRYSENAACQHMLALTTDGEQLICTGGFRNVLEDAGRGAQAYWVQLNQYLEKAPYFLRIEWDQLPQPAGTQGQLPTPSPDIKPFGSSSQALIALIQLDNNCYYPDRASGGHPGAYVKHAGIYDSKDGLPIWSKFLSIPDDPNLPGGVFIKLHEEKVTFETLSLTIHHFSAMAGKDDIQFLVCQATGHPHPPRHPSGRLSPPQQVRPPDRKGPSL